MDTSVTHTNQPPVPPGTHRSLTKPFGAQILYLTKPFGAQIRYPTKPFGAQIRYLTKPFGAQIRYLTKPFGGPDAFDSCQVIALRRRMANMTRPDRT